MVWREQMLSCAQNGHQPGHVLWFTFNSAETLKCSNAWWTDAWEVKQTHSPISNNKSSIYKVLLRGSDKHIGENEQVEQTNTRSAQLFTMEGGKQQNISHIYNSLPCKNKGMSPAWEAVCCPCPENSCSHFTATVQLRQMNPQEH